MIDENCKRVAIVHDWLVAMRGGEKVLEAICEMYPHADLYTLYCVRNKISEPLKEMRIKTSFLQNLVFFPGQDFRFYLPLFPLAIESFNMRDYDLVISTSHCVAKGVIGGSRALHICYCHTPMRYAWGFEDDYFGRMKSVAAAGGLIAMLMKYLRKWDKASSFRVDKFVANSRNTANRIKKYYGMESVVVYPPIDTDYFTPLEIAANFQADGGLMSPSALTVSPVRDKSLNGVRECDSSLTGFSPDARQKASGFFLVVSALVPYKRVDIAVEAFNRTGDKVKIVGDGPLRKELENKARPNIEFLGWVDKEALRSLYRGCDALVFPQEEDFGMAAVEAQACGKPVIAYAKGGVLEIIADKRTGLYFHEQNPDSLIGVLREFKTLGFDADFIRKNALRFNDKKTFKENIKRHITEMN